MYEKQAVAPRCMIKMDIQKAYDTIEWDFLDQMLQALKFPNTFRGWIMQCVTTATYSLNLNGNMFGFFKGQRGLRQGDPLSALLFTICMEYLTRLLMSSTSAMGFKFHPLSTSGLRMSKGKSNAYFNGVSDALKAYFLQVSGLVEGRLPFRYLGVPIKTTRFNAQDCKPLIDKIVARIRTLGARKLSYAGRPKKERGLRLKQDIMWNKAAVGKLVWWIYTKPDLLRVKWVNNIYLKGSAWQDYSPSTNSSWYWRKICQVKDDLHQAYQQLNWVPTGNGYTISKGYEPFRNKSHDVP
ncbi:uncharacterized protein LOC141655642 [Silene latifolia]|uniref:uncharacterized protein LOC141655642 n=1 Tax=Silene latifolia TaxID=37657 RepID=UPI003D788C53